MPQHYSGRIFLTLVILAVFLFAIFPIGTGHPLPNLKPGIDMAGGTSLLYEIKVPDNSTPDPQLAAHVMESLKKRIDPNGVRNLIWRPQGATRLEIQMPASGNEEVNNKLKDAFVKAQRELEATNVRSSDVIYTVESL